VRQQLEQSDLPCKAAGSSDAKYYRRKSAKTNLPTKEAQKIKSPWVFQTYCLEGWTEGAKAPTAKRAL